MGMWGVLHTALSRKATEASRCLASHASQRQRILLPVQETQEMWVRSLDWEDPLEKEMATHSSILAWEIPWTEEPGGLQSTGLPRVGHD